MTPEFVLGLAKETMIMGAMVAGPMMLAGLVVGLAISIFQTVTSIQEQTLSFVPKIVVMGIMLYATGGWMMENLMSFTRQTFALMQRMGP